MNTDVDFPDFLEQTLPYTWFVTSFSCWASAHFANRAACESGWIFIYFVDELRSLLTLDIVPRMIRPTVLIQLYILIYWYLHLNNLTFTQVL